MATRKLTNKYCRYAHCSELSATDKPVQHNLAMTPAKVRELTAKGIAVTLSAPKPGQFTDSDKNPGMDIDPIYTRDMDQNTLWENSEVSRHKILRSRDKVSVKRRQEIAAKQK